MRKVVSIIIFLILLFFILITVAYRNNAKIGDSLGIYTGKTTEAEVTEKFGKPSRIETGGDREKCITMILK